MSKIYTLFTSMTTLAFAHDRGGETLPTHPQPHPHYPLTRINLLCVFWDDEHGVVAADGAKDFGVWVDVDEAGDQLGAAGVGFDDHHGLVVGDELDLRRDGGLDAYRCGFDRDAVDFFAAGVLHFDDAKLRQQARDGRLTDALETNVH